MTRATPESLNFQNASLDDDIEDVTTDQINKAVPAEKEENASKGGDLFVVHHFVI